MSERSEHKDTESLYPKIISEDEVVKMIDSKVNHIDSLANKMRIDSIKDFIRELNVDFKKYQNKKRKYSAVKNVLTAVDVSVGTVLAIAGIVLEVVTVGASTIPSVIMGGIGFGIVCTLPLSMKISDRLESKNRNFTILSQKVLSEVKLIFSKALEDSYINQKEYELVINCRKNYLESKHKLKTLNKKQIDQIFSETNVKGITYKKKTNSEIQLDQLKEDVEKISKEKAMEELRQEAIENKKLELKEKLRSSLRSEKSVLTEKK